MALPDNWQGTFNNNGLTGVSFVCPHCKMATTFKVVTQYADPPVSELAPPNPKTHYHAVVRCSYVPCHKIVYVDTTKVRNALLQNYATDELITYPQRAIPEPHIAIPPAIAEDWVEAQRAFAANAPKASAVMCRRMLYGVLLERKCKEHPLHESLKQLAEQERLPKVVEQWLGEIRDDGHDAAHTQRALHVPSENVAEVLEFTKELLRFIYIEPYELQKRLARKAAPVGPV